MLVHLFAKFLELFVDGLRERKCAGWVSLERQAFLPERKAVSVVHCAQVEVFAQRDHALVVAADPFAAKFVDERRESLAMMLLGVDSPSVPVVRLQDVDFPPLLNCSVGGGETGETGPNDDALFF